VNGTEKETQKWDSMTLTRCVTGRAYRMRLVLQGSYEREDAEEARKFFRNWCAWVHSIGGRLENCSSRLPELSGWSRVTWKGSWPIGPEV
jgi:hypothetical protein